jgi:hypothetical protein
MTIMFAGDTLGLIREEQAEKCYVFYDLADLEDTKGKGNRSFLSSHISMLQNRMGTEEEVESQGFEAIVGNEPVKAIIVKQGTHGQEQLKHPTAGNTYQHDSYETANAGNWFSTYMYVLEI